MSTIKDVIHLLEMEGIDTYDEPPVITPEGVYAQVADDTGTAQPHRLSIKSHWAEMTFRVMAVSRTKDGCRYVLSEIRSALTGVRPSPQARPLFEDGAGTLLLDGPEGDKRWSAVIIYKTQVLTEGALQ